MQREHADSLTNITEVEDQTKIQ